MKRQQPFYDNPLPLAPVVLALITGAGAATGSVLASDYLQDKQKAASQQDNHAPFAAGIAAGTTLKNPLDKDDKRTLLYGAGILATFVVLSKFFGFGCEEKPIVVVVPLDQKRVNFVDEQGNKVITI